MMAALVLSVCLAGLVGFVFARRAAYYRQLSDKLAATLAGEQNANPFPSSIPGFGDNIAFIKNILPEDQFALLRSEVEGLTTIERSYVPTHKKGGTIAYSNLIERSPGVTRLYHSKGFHRFLSRLVGVEVRPTPLHDQSSMSVLVYERPGDHIDWHYDYNFYRGRHFTVLLPVVNSGRASHGLSHAELSAKIDGMARVITTPPNSLVVFEGARVLHKVSPIEEGEHRILISMTFGVDTRSTWAQSIARRLKDTAFFGVRALWT